METFERLIILASRDRDGDGLLTGDSKSCLMRMRDTETLPDFVNDEVYNEAISFLDSLPKIWEEIQKKLNNQ